MDPLAVLRLDNLLFMNRRLKVKKMKHKNLRNKEKKRMRERECERDRENRSKKENLKEGEKINGSFCISTAVACLPDY